MNCRMRIFVFSLLAVMTGASAGCTAASDPAGETGQNGTVALDVSETEGIVVDGGSVVALDTVLQLHAGMTIAEVTDLLGEPADDIGSGVHIYVYGLESGGLAVLGFDLDDLLQRVTVQERGGSERVIF